MSELRYRPDVDGLRAIAVGMVMAYHAFPDVARGGFTGVDVFFVISGYLISGIILDGLAGGRFTFANFYARRIRRIFPALAILLAAVLAGGWFLLYADDYARVGRQAAAGAAFVSNFVLWRESSYFDVAADLKPLLHLWSLGIEEQFYLVWPLMLVVAFRWRRGPIAMTLVVGSLSFLLAIWTVRIDRTPAFFAPWNRFWELLAGALLAAIERDPQFEARLRRLESGAVIRQLQSIAGLVMIAAGGWLIHSTRVFPGLWALLPAGGTVLLIASGPDAIVNRGLLSLRPIVWAGLISYPLYLWHWPLLSFAHIVRGTPLSVNQRLSLLAISVVLAAATYALVEKRIRFGVRRRGTVTALAVTMSLVCAAAIGVAASGGMIDRAINRSDAARLVDYYDRLHKTGIAAAYRPECDFMDWESGENRATIDPGCTAPGRAHTAFLWGDSFAQALSLGLRENLPAGAALAQVATSACVAAIDNFDRSVPGRRCQTANQYAMEAVERLKPELLIVAQSSAHAATDWDALTARAFALGARHIIIVGPFPGWRPSLPRVYGEHHLQDRAESVGEGLDHDNFAIDRALADRLAGKPEVTYLSLLDRLCHHAACLARVPGEGDLDLMAFDSGHLTPKGSSYLGREIFKPYLDGVIR